MMNKDANLHFAYSVSPVVGLELSFLVRVLVQGIYLQQRVRSANELYFHLSGLVQAPLGHQVACLCVKVDTIHYLVSVILYCLGHFAAGPKELSKKK